MNPSALLLAALLAATPQDAKTAEAKAPVDEAQQIAKAVVGEQLPSYPLENCVISGKKLGSKGDPIEHVVDGRLVRLCCEGCIKRVDADSKAAIAKVNEGVLKVQLASYPLKTCPVSGEELGSMGDPIEHVVGTRLARLCCKSCIEKIDADPAKYMAPIDEALIAAQRADYPLKTCPVSGEELGSMGEPIDLLYGTRLVRLCCKSCKKVLKKDPKSILAKLDEAAKSSKAKK